MKADGPLLIVYLKSNLLTYESESGNQTKVKDTCTCTLIILPVIFQSCCGSLSSTLIKGIQSCIFDFLRHCALLS